LSFRSGNLSSGFVRGEGENAIKSSTGIVGLPLRQLRKESLKYKEADGYRYGGGGRRGCRSGEGEYGLRARK
jgi:hypothetical protein